MAALSVWKGVKEGKRRPKMEAWINFSLRSNMKALSVWNGRKDGKEFFFPV